MPSPARTASKRALGSQVQANGGLLPISLNNSRWRGLVEIRSETLTLQICIERRCPPIDYFVLTAPVDLSGLLTFDGQPLVGSAWLPTHPYRTHSRMVQDYNNMY